MSTEELNKMPPHDLDAEEAVLGSLLLDGEAIVKIFDILKPPDFYRDKNQWVYDACCAVYERKEAINQVTVTHELGRRGRAEAMGGTAYLSNLIMNVPTSVHVEHYANIVRKCSQQRDLIMAGDAISAMAYDTEPEEATSEALQKILSLRSQASERGLERIGDYALEHYDEFVGWVDGGFQPSGVKTGFRDLDRILGGLKGGQLIYVCARPSMGKSQLLLNISKNCGLREEATAIFSLEMTKGDLFQSLVFAESRIDSQDLRRKVDFDRHIQAEKLKDKYSELMALPMWIDDTASLKTQRAQSKLLRIMVMEDIKVMFFDHLSLAGDEVKSGNEVLRIGRISKGLKAIAKICNVPVVAACQLSREVSKVRSNHRPHLEDLRWSGDLEQDADVVLGLYRDEYYNPEGSAKYKADFRNFLEISVLKQRRGAANPRGALGTGIFYDVHTGFMGDWQGEYPKRDEE